MEKMLTTEQVSRLVSFGFVHFLKLILFNFFDYQRSILPPAPVLPKPRPKSLAFKNIDLSQLQYIDNGIKPLTDRGFVFALLISPSFLLFPFLDCPQMLAK
jgi:hypothetical protein